MSHGDEIGGASNAGNAGDPCEGSDQAFLRAFERCEIQAAAFDHRAHVRMAWLYLRSNRHDGAVGALLIAEGLRAFAAAHGVPGKYEETTTRDWIARIEKAIARAPERGDFGRFAAENPDLFNRAREPATNTSSPRCGTDATSRPAS